MACILSRDSIRLFISYAPGTGSTSLEQHIRTQNSLLIDQGFTLEHFPKEEFGEGSDLSRHICYRQYCAITNDKVNYVATGIRNPFSYYYAEYNRILSKWSKLLDNPNSWIYRPESESTRQLAVAAKGADSFESWFLDILIDRIEYGYLAINEDHMDGATHFIRTEAMTGSFDRITSEIFGCKVSELIGEFPVVNVSGYADTYNSKLSEETRNLALYLFEEYMGRFNYQYGKTD